MDGKCTFERAGKELVQVMKDKVQIFQLEKSEFGGLKILRACDPQMNTQPLVESPVVGMIVSFSSEDCYGIVDDVLQRQTVITYNLEKRTAFASTGYQDFDYFLPFGCGVQELVLGLWSSFPPDTSHRLKLFDLVV